MASADAMEREAERRRLAFLAAARAAGFNPAPAGTPSPAIPSMTEAAGPITQPKPDGSFWGNVKGLGSMLGNTALSFVPGTQQSEDLSYLLQTNPQSVPMGMVESFTNTASNLADLAPIIDTGEPGINYINAYRRGEGLTMGAEDLLNLLAASQLAKAAKSATGVSVGDFVASRPASAIVADPEIVRMSALYVFLTNTDRGAAISALPEPTGVVPPRIIVPSDNMLNILDEGYKNMWEGGRRYPGEIPEGDIEDYTDWRQDTEYENLGGQQPIYGLTGDTKLEQLELYGGYSYTQPDGKTYRYPGVFWEIEPRLNRPMTTTAGDSFSVSPEDVFPYERRRILPQEKLPDPDLAYNEVQIYGGKILPEDIMNYSVNIVEPINLSGSTDAMRLAMVDENLQVVRRLIEQNEPITMNVYSSGPRQVVGQNGFQLPDSIFNKKIATYTGKDVLNYLIEQQNILRDRIRRIEK